VLGDGALDESRSQVVHDIGADWLGKGTTVEDYTEVGGALAFDLPASPFLNYAAAGRYRPRPGTEVVARIYEPYFDRTYGRYCSHQNTPNRTEPAAHPAAFRHGNVLVLAHALDAVYYQHGARVHRQFFRNALRLLLPDPMLDVKMPSAGRVTLLHQPQANRYVVHLSYACPMKRGRCEIIEDIVPLFDIPVTVRVPVPVTRACTIPGRFDLELKVGSGGAVTVVVPRLEGHTAVVLEGSGA